MMRFVLLGIVVAGTALGRPSFLEGAQKTVGHVWADLHQCGLLKIDAYVSKPQPQVPADYAVVNKRGRLLAYSLESFFGGYSYVFKAPNGGQVHRVSTFKDHIEFATPYAGTVAHANRFYTVDGPRYRFYCRSQVVNAAGFEACVKHYWVDVIAGQLCRWAR